MKNGYDVNALAIAGLENAVNESEAAFGQSQKNYSDKWARAEFQELEKIAFSHCADYVPRLCAGTYRKTAEAISDGARRNYLFPNTFARMSFLQSFQSLKAAFESGDEKAQFDAISDFSGRLIFLSSELYNVGDENPVITAFIDACVRYDGISIEYLY